MKGMATLLVLGEALLYALVLCADWAAVVARKARSLRSHTGALGVERG